VIDAEVQMPNQLGSEDIRIQHGSRWYQFDHLTLDIDLTFGFWNLPFYKAQ
jgi:hypothetical protein